MDYCAPIHASAFAYEGMGCLIIGESGTGKSRLLVEAIELGARLIADDQVRLCAIHERLVASPLPTLEGVVELRGLGLIRRADVVHSHPIHLVLSLDATAEGERQPTEEAYEFQGTRTPMRRVPSPPILSTATALLYLRAMQEGRTLPADWHPSA